MAEPVIVDLLRHGTVDAEGWAFRGATDVPLSHEGWRQMQDAVRDAGPYDALASSPLSRCRAFAEELARRHDTPLTVLDTMREMDFGDWENRGFEELEREHGELLHRFWQSPVGITPPNGEAFDAFAARVIEGWQAWLATVSGGRRLLVAHGGVIRVLLAHFLDMPFSALWRLHLPHASLSRVSLLEGHAPRVMFINGGQACAG